MGLERRRLRLTLLLAILGLAVLLRGVGLTEVPAGPIPDEASNAVDALCLARTGLDRYGQPLPLYLRGFGDYREAPFTYLAVPLIGLGVDPLLALRSAAVLIGLGTIVLTYAAGVRMFGPAAGLWAALFLACNPQHILWSRLGMEVIAVPLACAAAWWAYSGCTQHHPNGVGGLAAALVVCVYSGMMGKPAALVLSLSMGIGSWATWRWYMRQHAVRVGLAAGVALVALIPALWRVIDGSGTARWQMIRVRGESFSELVTAVFANVGTYASPRYWLSPKGSGLPALPNAGKMGYVEWGVLLLGLVQLLCARKRPGERTLLIFAIFAFFPAAVTETIAPSRMVWALPGFALIAGIGASWVIEKSGHRRLVVSALLLGVAAGVGLVVVDLNGPADRYLDEFFYGPPRRAVAEAMARSGEELVVIDAALPFAAIWGIYYSDADPAQYQSMATDPRRTGGIEMALPSLLVAAPEALPLDEVSTPLWLVTARWRLANEAGWRQVEEGPVKIFRRDGVRNR